MTNKDSHTNRLAKASSPYLLQHAHNPVDWWEWCDEAFEKARREDKLVLVSIGYSACHWCHVMERECFEQEDTAALMNENFICIKVDREERPDVDQVYMDAVQLLTGRGGWPLNCFTLPDGRPLPGGTYFPKQEWERVLRSLSDFYRTNKAEALRYADELTEGVRKLDLIPATENAALLPLERVDEIMYSWKESFDLELGGFAWAPKFPMPNNFRLFLEYWYYRGDETALEVVNRTLTCMAEGGIFDQAGGGFARYSTDVFWKVPHFEKMLYDNAQLMSLYSQAYLQSNDELYKKTVYKTHRFICDELSSPEGLFYAALDADSEGVEGKFYVWTKKELTAILGADEPLYSLYYSIDAHGNWEHGTNILYRTRNNAELEQLTGKSIADIESIVEACHAKVLAARSSRVRPGLDDKIVTSWNALMIKGYAEAALAFNDSEFLATACRAADAVLGHQWNGKMLYRIRKNESSSVPAFAEDYAMLIDALLSLYEASMNEAYVLRAKELMDVSLQLFYNGDTGLFRFGSNTQEQLVVNKTDVGDDVIPSANAIFARCLYLLSFYFESNDYLGKSKRMVLAVQPKIEKFPSGHANWLQLVLLMNHAVYQLVICGVNAMEERKSMRRFMPGVLVLALDKPGTIPLLADKEIGDKTVFYVCEDRTCSLPLYSAADAMKLIS